ncbi:MAG: Heat shock protein GrpE [Acidobacteriales bacterium]|nr:Heat shock protein GrpE [Terriglobales bacterium]
MKDRESNVHEELLPPESGSDSGENGQSTPNQNRPADREAGAPEFSAGVGDPRDQIVRLQAERDALFDRLARQQADFENQRKRNAREQTEFRDFAIANTVKSLLPILDNFDLALKAGNTNENDLRKGLELIRRQMDEVLTKLGVEPVNAKGEPFDPRYHEAIEMVESSDVRDNHVLDELQRGYKLKDRLLRPAMVRVAKNSKK